MRKSHSLNKKSLAMIAASIYLAVILVIAITFVRYSILNTKNTNLTNQELQTNYFDDLNIEAKAIYVYDFSSNKVLFEKNSALPLPLASITKIMTALCVLENVDKNTIISIPQSILKENGDKNLNPGDMIRLDDLASYTLVKSSNDGAMALSSSLGGSTTTIACMNRRANELGLFDTHFFNETGLDIDGLPGAYGSAQDSAKLLVYAYRKYPNIFGNTKYQTYSSTENNTTRTAVNTNKVQGSIVGMRASKTGLTDLAGGNLVFLMDAGLGHTIVVSILNSSEEGRFDDALLISNAVIKSLGNIK